MKCNEVRVKAVEISIRIATLLHIPRQICNWNIWSAQDDLVNKSIYCPYNYSTVESKKWAKNSQLSQHSPLIEIVEVLIRIDMICSWYLAIRGGTKSCCSYQVGLPYQMIYLLKRASPDLMNERRERKLRLRGGESNECYMATKWWQR